MQNKQKKSFCLRMSKEEFELLKDKSKKLNISMNVTVKKKLFGDKWEW